MAVAEKPRVAAAHHSLSGTTHGSPPAHTLLQRAAAAEAAGITEIGACADDLGDWAPRELERLVRHHNVRVAELEWVDLGDPRDEVREERLFALADLFGARQLNVGVCSPDQLPVAYLAKRLRHLAARASFHDLTIAFEPVVFGSVATVDRAEAIIARAGHPPNVGTLIDTYHMARASWASIEAISPELVVAIQLCDVDLLDEKPSWPHGLFTESQNNRRLPGDGDFPLGRWLASLRAAGVRARTSIEVISSQLRSLPLYESAQAIADASARYDVR
jgi:4-hydroxyphenylpyruvate dioxygenase